MIVKRTAVLLFKWSVFSNPYPKGLTWHYKVFVCTLPVVGPSGRRWSLQNCSRLHCSAPRWSPVRNRQLNTTCCWLVVVGSALGLHPVTPLLTGRPLAQLIHCVTSSLAACWSPTWAVPWGAAILSERATHYNYGQWVERHQHAHKPEQEGVLWSEDLLFRNQ